MNSGCGSETFAVCICDAFYDSAAFVCHMRVRVFWGPRPHINRLDYMLFCGERRGASSLISNMYTIICRVTLKEREAQTLHASITSVTCYSNSCHRRAITHMMQTKLLLPLNSRTPHRSVADDKVSPFLSTQSELPLPVICLQLNRCVVSRG